MRNAPVSVSQVSSRWRKLACQDPKLWTGVYLDERGADVGFDPRRICGALDAFATWARDGNLAIFFDYSAAGVYEPDLEEDMTHLGGSCDARASEQLRNERVLEPLIMLNAIRSC